MADEPLFPDEGEPGTAGKRIEDYGLIGNTLSAALVGNDGSIDWLCLPRFDSDACFAALVGTRENGRWRIAPRKKARVSRRYLPDTAVLETTFETSEGRVSVTDFMPFTDVEEKMDVVRIVTGLSGEVALGMELTLRFGYGKAVPWVRRRDYGLSAVAGPDAVELHTTVPLEGEDLHTLARFTVREGESVPFTLSYHRSHREPHFIPDRHQCLERTAIWWREWVRKGDFATVPEPWRDPVVRSLITIKMLTFSPTGGIVAAPTTSLPEAIGGARNWDYRFCWLRDSALTLIALLNAGYRPEAEDWRQWLLRAVAGHPKQLQIMYGVSGERRLPEFELDWMAGYEGSRPVRVGNAASQQVQLDVFGELVETLHASRVAELQPQSEAWRLQKVLLEHLEGIWQQPDRGIWEVRGEARPFTHSRMMCWVAFDRAVTGVERFGLEGPVDHWRSLRAKIHAEICAKGFDTRRNSFMQSYGGRGLDASLLLMPKLGFLPPTDPRVRGTIAAIEGELMADGFVRRYSPEKTDDGVGGQEGAFLACSFWLADAYVLCGRHDDARALFERLLGVRNDLGLLAEEYDPIERRQLGNVPQAFSHVGLINTAFALGEAARSGAGAAEVAAASASPAG